MAVNNFRQADPRRIPGDGDESPTGTGVGDMLKSVYDKNNDGRVDAADHATLAAEANNLTAPPGFNIVYGRNQMGVLGWYLLREEGLDFVEVSNFIDLSDVPNDYTGQAGKLVKVNATEDGLEFSDLPEPPEEISENTLLLWQGI